MAKRESRATPIVARTRPEEAAEILKALGFSPKQSNEVAAYTLLALLDVRPKTTWSAATNPLRGITPIIEFIHEAYAVRYAPNTRETFRDEALKYFVESGLVIRSPDDSYASQQITARLGTPRPPMSQRLRMPDERSFQLGCVSDSSFVSPRRACAGKEQRVVPEVWADFAEIGCG